MIPRRRLTRRQTGRRRRRPTSGQQGQRGQQSHHNQGHTPARHIARRVHHHLPGPRDRESREPPAGNHQLTAEDVNAWLDGKLPDALKNGGIPGAVVSVVKDGQVVTTRGYGWADTGASGGNSVAVDPQKSLFRVASVSKIPTSIAVMQLVEQGKVDLDADISAYLDFEIERRFDEPLTLRHLLTHSAGFEERWKVVPDDGPGGLRQE